MPNDGDTSAERNDRPKFDRARINRLLPLRKLTEALSQAIEEYLAPRRCVVCRELIPLEIANVEAAAFKQALFGRFTCLQCDPLHPRYHHLLLPGPGRVFSDRTAVVIESTCICCGEYGYSTSSGDGLCNCCAKLRPSFRHLLSVFSYQGPIEALIRAYKYERKTSLAEPFSMLLFAALHAAISETTSLGRRWDIIVPIPGSPKTERARGFHHTNLLAQRLGQMLGIPAVEALTSSARRQPQVLLKPQEREKNARGCFHVIHGELRGKRILLVDDVTTTGYTAEAAAVALLERGASIVDLITIARSPHFGSLRAEALSTRSGKVNNW